MSQSRQRPDDFVAHASELTRDARKVVDDVQTIYHNASDRVNLGQFYQEKPLVVLGVAAGVGYVLGGGLFTPFTARLLRLGTRFLLLPMVTSQLERALPQPPSPQSSTPPRHQE